MKLINRGTANTLIFTLNEKSELASPVYLFRFISKLKNTSTTCIATDTSSYTYRYNQFVITESDSEDRTNGTLQLKTTGEYIYEVYEQSSSSNLDHAQASKLLETGIVRVIDSTTTHVYKTHTYTNTVYGTGA